MPAPIVQNPNAQWFNFLSQGGPGNEDVWQGQSGSTGGSFERLSGEPTAADRADPLASPYLQNARYVEGLGWIRPGQDAISQARNLDKVTYKPYGIGDYLTFAGLAYGLGATGMGMAGAGGAGATGLEGISNELAGYWDPAAYGGTTGSAGTGNWLSNFTNGISDRVSNLFSSGAESFTDPWDAMGNLQSYGLDGGGYPMPAPTAPSPATPIPDIQNGPLDWLKKLLGQGGGGSSGPLGAYKPLFDIASGAYNLFGSKTGKDLRNLSGTSSDAASQLRALQANPDAIMNLPGYAGLSKAREQAVSRRAAAQGYNLSGNEKIALADTGGEQYMQFRNAELDRLSRMAQGGVAPATASAQFDANSINRLIYGASRLFA